MTTEVTLFKIFLSSPGDVAEERALTDTVRDQVNVTSRDSLNLSIDLVKWEDESPEASADNTTQEKINKKIQPCNAFILVLGERYGQVEDGYTQGNTEREINVALEILRRRPGFRVLAFKKNFPNRNDPGPQYQRVMELEERLKSLGVLIKYYNDPKEYQSLITHELYRLVIRYRVSTTKHEMLSKFWRFGQTESYSDSIVSIIYPQSDNRLTTANERTGDWGTRLQPLSVFEHEKAIQKIIKTLRILNVHRYKVYSTDQVPASQNQMNRIFICVPRNIRGHKILEEIKDYTRFQFKPRNGKKEAKILWRGHATGPYFEVASPLSRYLQEQRDGHDLFGDWDPSMNRIVAKDYAVLARIRNRDDSLTIRHGHGPLVDYFVAGIRGLGTWGAARFIDREYKQFSHLEDEYLDFEKLLEVTFMDGRIVSVSDVSDRPVEYFREQNKVGKIRQIIREYKESHS